METEIKNKVCENCEGTGKEKYSCCGDEMEGSIYEDIGLCPTCKEHTGGECYDCHGSGIAPTQHEIILIINKGTHGDMPYRLTANAETEEEAMKVAKKYTAIKKWVIVKIVSINKLK